jgi:hypothetical protein
LINDRLEMYHVHGAAFEGSADIKSVTILRMTHFRKQNVP